MHITFMARGIKHDLDRFINELSTKYLPLTWTTDGKKEEKVLQVRVCPVEIYDVSFPREHRDAMLTTLFKNKGKPINARLNKFVLILRKLMGLKPIPENWDEKNLIPCYPPLNVEMIAIGMKDDKIAENGNEQI